MSVSIESVLNAPNDSIGSTGLNVSPYLIDGIAITVVAGAWYTDNLALRLAGLVVAAILAVWAALCAKRLRIYIKDTPRSKIGSAAQGFVELQGKCEFYGNRTTQGFLHGPPCVWHRYTIGNAEAQTSHSGNSDLPFVIRDETGTCVVNPSGAKIISSGKRSWYKNGKYYRTRYIRHGAQLYVIGELRTNCNSQASYNERAELANVLKTWKRDQSWMLAEFDLDNDGEIDAKEWEQARARAAQIASDKFESRRIERVENAIKKPSNGLPMLISDQHPDKLALKFRWLGFFNFFVAGFCVLAIFHQLFS